MAVEMFDPNSTDNPAPKPLEIVKVNGEIVTVDQFRHEQQVAKATLARTVRRVKVGYEKHRDDTEPPEGLTYSA